MTAAFKYKQHCRKFGAITLTNHPLMTFVTNLLYLYYPGSRFQTDPLNDSNNEVCAHWKQSGRRKNIYSIIKPTYYNFIMSIQDLNCSVEGLSF